MKRVPWISAVVLASMMATAAIPGWAGGVGDVADPLPPHVAFAAQARTLADGRIEYRVDIQPGYHLYRDRIRAEWVDAAGKAHPLVFERPPGKMVDDATFGRIAVYDEPVVLRTALPAAAAVAAGQPAGLDVISQGCAKAGICFPPHRQRFQPAGAAPGSWVGPSGEAKTVSMRSLLGEPASAAASRTP